MNIAIKEICPTTTQRWIRNGALLVDVRERSEVSVFAFDVEDFLHVPLSEFENRFQEIPKNRRVVLVCKNGDRSLRATNFLINAGYNPENVANMKYGLLRWLQKGFPTIGDADYYLKNDTDCCSSGSCC